MSYEQRLKEMAEKLAKEWHKPPTGAFRFGPVEWELIKLENRSISIETMLPLAEICLAEMAKLVNEAYTFGAIDNIVSDQRVGSEAYLQQLGLIPVQ